MFWFTFFLSIGHWHSMQLTTLKCSGHCFLEYTENCAAIIVTFRTFSSARKESPYLLPVIPHSLDGTDNPPEWYKDSLEVKTSEVQEWQKPCLNSSYLAKAEACFALCFSVFFKTLFQRERESTVGE